MANESAKKTLRENAKRLRWLRQIALGAAALHVLLRVLLRGTRLWERVFFVASLAASGAAYRRVRSATSRLGTGALALLRAMARPTYGPQGELVDGGSDVSKAETAQDVVYLMAMTHVLSCASSAAWLLVMAIPGVACSWLWRTLLSPWIFSAQEGEEGGAEGARGQRGKGERRGRAPQQRR